MKKTTRIIVILSILLKFTSFSYADDNQFFSLTVQVDELRNSQGVVQFALYNKDGSIPDEKYEKYYKTQTENINNGSSFTVFSNLPKGRYAVNVLHDENANGKVDKGFIFPIEGIGFTNYSSIGLNNRPNFIKASFDIMSNTEKLMHIIYSSFGVDHNMTTKRVNHIK